MERMCSSCGASCPEAASPVVASCPVAAKCLQDSGFTGTCIPPRKPDGDWIRSCLVKAAGRNLETGADAKVMPLRAVVTRNNSVSGRQRVDT